jgi:hypothetical protein
VIVVSAISMRPATDAAYSRAETRHLHRVDDAGLHHVDDLARRERRSPTRTSRRGSSTDSTVTSPSKPAFSATCAHRRTHRREDDVDAELLVALRLATGVFDGGDAAQERGAAAGDDAFARRARGVHGVLDAELLLGEFLLGGRTDRRSRPRRPSTRRGALGASRGRSRTCRDVDLRADLPDALFDRLLLTFASTTIVSSFFDDDLLRAAEVGERDGLEGLARSLRRRTRRR